MKDSKVLAGKVLSGNFSPELIKSLWASGKKLEYDGIQYRVGRMSYGDYFLEPGPEHRETDGFNRGTLWLEKAQDGKTYQ